MITGKDLIERGYKPGAWFKKALEEANKYENPWVIIELMKPEDVVHIPLQDSIKFYRNIIVDNKEELDNYNKVCDTMDQLMRVPTVVSGAIMPDACPSGIIPVGAVIATKNAIHPGFHSADVCCSIQLSNLGKVPPKDVLDAAMLSTHFGYGGRKDPPKMSHDLDLCIRSNKFLAHLIDKAIKDFGSQGDGNHFLFVGTLKSTGDTCVVTHHGSRGLGAGLYKAGMKVAEKYRREMSPETPVGAAWIPFDTEDGEKYWEALEIVGYWTRMSHFAIHDEIASRNWCRIKDWFWNEHNYVFHRNDDLFYHAKGATPGWKAYKRTLVPLNMAEPILITKGTDNPKSLGFLPHGAGRNLSRTQYLKNNADLQLPEGIDARFWSGKPDLSELPSAYKNAEQIKRQIELYNMAEVIDEVLPYGNIMAGEMEQFWRKKK